MSDKIKAKNENMWILYTVFFSVFTITSLALILWNLLVGVLVVILSCLFFMVGWVIKAYCNRDRDAVGNPVGNSIICPPEDQVKKVQNLLRYATAVLAFLSLITTANGMKSVVFNSEWMAYFASFAVQSILVTFSLLLCRFVVRVASLSWPVYVKRLANGIMIIFFCVFLTVSSVFSFSYIANNAYADNWVADCETMIQNYLIENAYALREENEYRKKYILNEINNTAQNSLIAAASRIKQKENDELSERLKTKLNIFVYEKKDQTKLNIDKESWDQKFARYTSQGELLYEQYMDTYAKGYSEVVERYNGILDEIEDWKDENDNSIILSEAESIIQEIPLKQANLEGLVSAIGEWRTSGLINDISTYRGTFETEVTSLNVALDSLQQYVEEIRDLVQAIDNNNAGDPSKEVDEVLSQIYLLGTDETVKVEDITIKINTLIEQSMDFYGSTEINDIVTFKEKLATYEECMDLSVKLDTYINERLRRTYNIDVHTFQGKEDSEENTITDSEREDTEESQAVEAGEQSIYVISKETWEEERNNDFYTLITLVKLLPDVEIKDNESNHVRYDDNAVLNEASILQRNLLGQVTDIERAFNYFDSYFPMMACFAAFIAVFFDLGAFFAGCFLYITEFF